MPRRRWLVWAALVVILVGYWAAFAAYPLPGPDFDYAGAGASPGWEYNYSGFTAHWNKNTNLAWAFDTWFLNLFPRDKPFRFNDGGYATLSFLPTLATMILGLIAGGWLRDGGTTWRTAGRLTVAGAVCLALGLAADYFGICPSVKRIWTPAWTLYSGGWCFLILAGFYVVMDLGGWRAWAFPLRVIGMNSIAAYVLAHLFVTFTVDSFKTHLGREIFQTIGTAFGVLFNLANPRTVSAEQLRAWGAAYEPFATGVMVLLVLWLILYWMERRRILIRI
jgi:predicted acyltransferase